MTPWCVPDITLQWRQNEHHGVSNHRLLDCLVKRLFRRRSKKTSKICVTGLWEGNPPVTGGFPSRKASRTENVSIWWRHHDAHGLRFVVFPCNLTTGWLQTTTKSNTDLLLSGPFRTNFQWNLNQMCIMPTTFSTAFSSIKINIIQENGVEKVVCKILTFLFRPRNVKLPIDFRQVAPLMKNFPQGPQEPALKAFLSGNTTG